MGSRCLLRSFLAVSALVSAPRSPNVSLLLTTAHVYTCTRIHVLRSTCVPLASQAGLHDEPPWNTFINQRWQPQVLAVRVEFGLRMTISYMHLSRGVLRTVHQCTLLYPGGPCSADLVMSCGQSASAYRADCKVLSAALAMATPFRRVSDFGGPKSLTGGVNLQAAKGERRCSR